MSIFNFMFFFALVYLLFSIFKEPAFMKFLFSLFGKSYPNDKEPIDNAVFVYERLPSGTFTKEERFALALGDLEHERLVEKLTRVNLHKHLEEEWGLSFSPSLSREHTLYTLQKIWSEGTLSLVSENAYLKHEVSIADMVAFDSARFTELLRQVLYFNFLDEEAFWGFLFLNAQRVQDCYENEEVFKEAYFRGLALYTMDNFEVSDSNNYDCQKEARRMQEESSVEITWLEEDLFSHFKKAKNL